MVTIQNSIALKVNKVYFEIYNSSPLSTRPRVIVLHVLVRRRTVACLWLHVLWWHCWTALVSESLWLYACIPLLSLKSLVVRLCRSWRWPRLVTDRFIRLIWLTSREWAGVTCGRSLWVDSVRWRVRILKVNLISPLLLIGLAWIGQRLLRLVLGSRSRAYCL